MKLCDKFIEETIAAGKLFIEKNSVNKALILGHFDTDGLASAVILSDSLRKENIESRILIKQHIDNSVLEELKNCSEEIIFSVDIGANKEKELNSLGKQIIILDHHNPQRSDDENLDLENVRHINPFLFDLTERNTISGAGVVYYFCLGINKSNKEFAHLAILGAIGDTQERNGFEYLNNTILQHAILQKTISVGKRLRLFGINSRPLIKVLEYSTDLSIPGVTNDEVGVKQLLKELNIDIYWNGRLRKYFNLRDYEKESLTNKILELKKDEPVENIIVPTYTLLNERKRSFQDMKECATIINACGRLEKFEVGMNSLRGNIDAQDEAISNLRTYKNFIREAFMFIDEHKENPDEDYILGNGFVIVNLHDKINSSLVGIVASILARNKHYPEGTIVCTLAEHDSETIKISTRVSGDSSDKNLQEILQSIGDELGFSSGGHKNAAGCIIHKTLEKNFLNLLQEKLSD